MQSLYKDGYDILHQQLGWSDKVILTVVATVAMEIGFWTRILLMEVITRLHLFEDRKINLKPVIITKERRMQALRDTLTGHLVIRPILLYFTADLTFRCGVSMSPADFPGLGLFLWHTFLCMFIDDTWFYWTHRIAHENKWLYKHVHKQHHLNTAPEILIATEDAHWAEDLFISTAATVMGPLVIGCHFATMVIYFVLRLVQSMDAHCGYNLPWYLSPWSHLPGMDAAPMHNFHHSHNIGTYGGWFVFWDYVMGTDAAYLTWELKLRDTAKDSSRPPAFLKPRSNSELAWLKSRADIRADARS